MPNAIGQSKSLFIEGVGAEPRIIGLQVLGFSRWPSTGMNVWEATVTMCEITLCSCPDIGNASPAQKLEFQRRCDRACVRTPGWQELERA
ncbi:Uu.00g028380.m01.CDS01 [Anthostomella pinea]|uniref:Uu.00g028380.m01.CDS01 n=1 Tax=Anthostomella pinea TaxID=933095 RepID=A0AAI8V7X8_9PEZI|nr:Uu.00g028380.m01.CDS01 [Anthostomella pinea]